MTSYSDVSQRVFDRINSAPVEDWLKREAREDLRKLVAAHEEIVFEQKKEADVKYATEETAVRAEIDYSWVRRELVSELVRSRPHLSVEQIIADAKRLDEFVQKG